VVELKVINIKNMQIIGIILIIIVIMLYLLWLWYTKNQSATSAKIEKDVQTFNILVKGVYSPNIIKAKKNKLVRINFVRKESTDCSRFVNFTDFKIRKELPEGEKITIEIMPEKSGVFPFNCDMNMYQGKLIIE